MRIVTLKDVGAVTSDITDGVYQGSAISAWSGTSSYAVGDIKYYAGTRPNLVWKCISAVTHTAGTEPIPSLDPTRWGSDPVGCTDRDAEFDNLLGTQSQRATSHTATVDSSKTNYVAFFNIDAASITLTLTVSGSSVKTETIGLGLYSGPPSWYNYFFATVERKTQLIWEYPYYEISSLTVTFTTATGNLVKCGVFRWGVASSHIAGVLKGPQLTLIDYSTKGTIYAVNQGPSADKIDFEFMLNNSNVDIVKNLFKANIGRTVVVDCNDATGDILDSFIIYAIAKEFRRSFQYKNIIKCTASVLGVS